MSESRALDMKIRAKAVQVLAGLCICASMSACRAATICDGAATAAIKLSIRDAQTQGPISSKPWIIWTSPSGAVDSLTVDAADAAISVGIGTVGGAYSLTVRADGYNDWHTAPVVAQEKCRPETVPIDARLIRAGD